MNTMAAVAKSSPSDGRIACPQCGGLVHPIAGKCKHCKADLAEARGARPAAAAALPALAGGGTARPAMRADATPVPAKPSPISKLVAAENIAILPPRETGRMPAQKSGGSLLKNWPVVVIIIAGIAIAAAVVLMVWPPGSTAKADTRIPPPPAPERMETNPLPPKGSMVTPPSNGQDPWSNKGTAPDPQPDPDDQASIDPNDPSKDPFSLRGGGNLLGSNVMFSVFEHACARATSCGNSSLASMCSVMSQALGPTPPPSCAAAQRCIEHIDTLPCDAQMSSQADILSMMTTFQDCAEAIKC